MGGPRSYSDVVVRPETGTPLNTLSQHLTAVFPNLSSKEEFKKNNFSIPEELTPTRISI